MRLCLSLVAGLFTVLFSGCATVGPDYVPPEKKVPAKFNSAMGEDENAKSVPPQTEAEGLAVKIPIKQVTPEMLADWWNTLEDPLLTQLVERAVKGNLDLKLAQSRLREERARRGIARADRFPTINADGSVTRQKTSKESNTGKESDLFSTGFDASWEVDLFGGIKRSVESAEASLEARREELNDTLVSLVAEVALNYVEIRSFQARLEAAEKSRKSQEDSLQIVQDRLDSGLTTTLSLEQAKYNLESTKSEIPTLRTGIEQGKNGLAVLLGEFPGSLKKLLATYKKIPITPVEVAVGVPADLLRRRPDVRLRERELAAQTALVGVATADLYPKLTLFGSIGLESLSAASLFTGPAAAFQIGPKITWNVFDAGRIRDNIKVEDERQEQALIQYESSVLTAVKDVENALIDYADEQVRRKSLLKSTQSAKRAADLARELYTAGLSDFIGVLDAERALFSFQDQLASSEGQVTSNLIRLFKALGGGWKPLMVDAPQEVPKSKTIQH
jgi:NodT family efflux transporter outer membrane factor (OMF) lipoprotein